MKITAIKTTPVNLPLEAPYRWTTGISPGTSKVIIEVFTDEGVVGLGEAPSPDCLPLLEAYADKLVGIDAFDISAIERMMVPETRVLYNSDDSAIVKAFGGLEIALWDIRGKAWDQPLYMLLGGAVRKEIPFTEYFASRCKHGDAGGESTPEEVAAYCARMREEHGSTFFEGKDSFGTPDESIRTVKLIRDAIGPDAKLRLDANMGWSLSTARRMVRELEKCNISNYEDPVCSFEEMAKLRQHTSIPFSTHIPDLSRAVALGVPDAFVLNSTVLGGIKRTVAFVAACERVGIDFWCYSGDAGIQSAVYLHIVAATQWIREPSQSLFRWQTDDVIQQGPFKPKNNVIRVPEGPGIGVDMDPVSLKRCHDRYCKDGAYNNYHDPDAPGLKRRLPLY